MRLDYTQKNRANGQTALTSTEQNTGLELNRQQARGQVWSQPGGLDHGFIGRGLILRQAQRQSEAVFAILAKEHVRRG